MSLFFIFIIIFFLTFIFLRLNLEIDTGICYWLSKLYNFLSFFIIFHWFDNRNLLILRLMQMIIQFLIIFKTVNNLKASLCFNSTTFIWLIHMRRNKILLINLLCLIRCLTSIFLCNFLHLFLSYIRICLAVLLKWTNRWLILLMGLIPTKFSIFILPVIIF